MMFFFVQDVLDSEAGLEIETEAWMTEEAVLPDADFYTSDDSPITTEPLATNLEMMGVPGDFVDLSSLDLGSSLVQQDISLQAPGQILQSVPDVPVESELMQAGLTWESIAIGAGLLVGGVVLKKLLLNLISKPKNTPEPQGKKDLALESEKPAWQDRKLLTEKDITYIRVILEPRKNIFSYEKTADFVRGLIDPSFETRGIKFHHYYSHVGEDAIEIIYQLTGGRYLEIYALLMTCMLIKPEDEGPTILKVQTVRRAFDEFTSNHCPKNMLYIKGDLYDGYFAFFDVFSQETMDLLIKTIVMADKGIDLGSIPLFEAVVSLMEGEGYIVETQGKYVFNVFMLYFLQRYIPLRLPY